MREPLKKFFLSLPGVRRVASQRDTLASECLRLEDQIATLQQAREVLRDERDKLQQRLDGLNDARSTAEQRRVESAEALEEASEQLEALRAEMRDLKRRQGFVPPGHFYSPIPDLDEISARQSDIFGKPPESLPGLELNADDQLKLLQRFAEFYGDLPFTPEPSDGLRYHYENPAYSYSDAIMLHCMIRYLKPRRIVEIGSGYSSCVMLDTSDRFFDGSIDTTFIEPYPELLQDLILPADLEQVRIIDRPVQEVALETFDALGENDILFVDSTHVSKVGSDVNRIFFDVLPRLRAGVHVHFHDIAYPFEYPKDWVFDGRAWNENYLLRTFLSFNRDFRVLLMNTYMHQLHPEFFERHMPLCLRNPGGSIWMRRE